MKNKVETCIGLLELIKWQEEVISRQNATITELTNENLEKENIINILMQEQSDMY